MVQVIVQIIIFIVNKFHDRFAHTIFSTLRKQHLCFSILVHVSCKCSLLEHVDVLLMISLAEGLFHVTMCFDNLLIWS